MTIKYISFLSFFSFLSVSVIGQMRIDSFESKVDSIYQSMSMDEKLNAILINPDNKANIQSYSINWLKLDSIFNYVPDVDPLFSDVLIRSALLNGTNNEIINDVIEILRANRKDGFCYPLKSPYSLMFQPNNSTINDFILEPYGRIVIPYKEVNQNAEYFICNTYKFPENVLSPHILNTKQNITNLDIDNKNILGLHGVELRKLMEAYENPALETILKFGGLFITNNKEKDFKRLKRVFSTNTLSHRLLEKSCKKSIQIFLLKSYKPDYKKKFSIKDIGKDLVEKLYRQSQVLLVNKDIIPVNDLKNRRIASIHIGIQDVSPFQNMISFYCNCDHYNTNSIPDEEELFRLKKLTESYNTIIVGVNGDWFDKNENAKLYSFLHQISGSADLILVHFGSGNSLSNLPLEHPFKAVLLSYEVGKIAQEHSAQILFGGIEAKGSLAKNINDHFSFGCGNYTKHTRLGFSDLPTEAYRDTLSLIDQIAYKAIRERATPGCQVLVAKDGNIIYNKAFGYHTYDKKRHVLTSDIYDIASVTKITSSIPSVMKLVDEGKLNISDSLSIYLPRLKNTNKSGIVISDMLVHQAGLESWIPFYLRAIDKEKLEGDIYSTRYSPVYNIKLDNRVFMNKSVRFRTDVFRHIKSSDFPIKVCDRMYMNRDFVDSIKLGIDTSAIAISPEYRYSDLGYYYLKEIIEKIANVGLEDYVFNSFYKPLGAKTTGYLPLNRFSEKDIVPTEDDRAWRKELIHGYVHDPGAAMLGGVGGHAGIFSNAQDLAKILQMYLNYGAYGNERYIDSITMVKFSSVAKEGNRRGLGFDKPVLDQEFSGPCSSEASPFSYGHSGFTGTLVWIDPKYNLIYIFLSNRINPNQYNKKLITDDVRTNIQSAIYRSLPEFWENKKKGIE